MDLSVFFLHSSLPASALILNQPTHRKTVLLFSCPAYGEGKPSASRRRQETGFSLWHDHDGLHWKCTWRGDTTTNRCVLSLFMFEPPGNYLTCEEVTDRFTDVNRGERRAVFVEEKKSFWRTVIMVEKQLVTQQSQSDGQIHEEVWSLQYGARLRAH